MNSITYRPAVRADIPRLQEIFNAQYARKKGAPYFHWQYFDSAWPTTVICAEENGIVEGMFGLQRRELAGGIPVGQAIDLLITPRLRGKGVFAEMGQRAAACFPDIRLLCVLPNLNGRNACVKSLGWQEIAKIDELVLTATDSIPIPDLPARAEQAGTTYFNWTEELRAWRFDRHPDYAYETVCGAGGTFATTKVFQDPVTGRRFGDIVNFTAPLDQSTLLARLFIAAAGHLAEKGVESVTTWALPHTLLHSVLTAIGFSAKPQERYFCVKSLDPSLDNLQNIVSWHLVQSDAEIY
jgi:hypothetical protein